MPITLPLAPAFGSLGQCCIVRWYWSQMAEALYWYKRWQPKHHSFNFDVRKGPISAEWFKGGRTNMCYNCLDRWVEAGRGNQACFLWEGVFPDCQSPVFWMERSMSIFASLCFQGLNITMSHADVHWAN